MSRQHFSQAGAAARVYRGRLVQRVWAAEPTYRSLTGNIPDDDTIPQSTEGEQVLTATITPRHKRNLLRIRVGGHATMNTIGTLIAALFRDAAAGAVASTRRTNGGNNYEMTWALEHAEAAGSTAPTTFKLRLGRTAGSGLWINGLSVGRRMGGTMATTMAIEEAEPL